MTSRRMPYECGDCGRGFYEAYKLEKHFCQEELSILEKLKEWREFRNTSEMKKFIHEVNSVDPALAGKIWRAWSGWKKGIPPSAHTVVKETFDPMEDKFFQEADEG